MTSLQTNRISLGDSIYICDKYKGLFKEEECYNNAFKALGYLNIEDKKSGYVGCIGYVLSTDGINKVAVRHAWLKNKYNAIIDVTMPLYDYGIQSMLSFEYTELCTFTLKEWLGKIERNRNIPCILNIRGEKKVIETLIIEGFQVLGN